MRTAAVLLTLAALLPSAAGAQTAPVAITGCTVLQYQYSHARPFWNPWWGPGPNGGFGSPYTDGVAISYHVTAAKPAARVAFLVNYRGDVEHIVDAGTFSPGVTIAHTFGQLSGLAYEGPRPNACRVVAVRFADGSVWRASRPQAAR